MHIETPFDNALYLSSLSSNLRLFFGSISKPNKTKVDDHVIAEATAGFSSIFELNIFVEIPAPEPANGRSQFFVSRTSKDGCESNKEDTTGRQSAPSPGGSLRKQTQKRSSTTRIYKIRAG